MKPTACPECGREQNLGAGGSTQSDLGLDCASCLAVARGATLKLSQSASAGSDKTLRSMRSDSFAVAEIDLAELLEGKSFAGYHVERLLGRGGMAWVFLAQHRDLRRPCALKLLCPSQQASDVKAIDEFLDEARSAAAIVHPHVVTVHNVGIFDERPFVELEFVSGETLSASIGQRSMPHEVVIETVAQAVAGLVAAHELGFVHRDFKPSNILISQTGLAKLSDFGLAHRIDSAQSRLAGTPSYMAPELFAGAAPSPRCDIYAVGVTLLECLTGEFQFRLPRWTDIAKLHQNLTWESIESKLEGTASPLQTIVRRCMSKQPAERYESAQELHRALRECQRMLRPLDRLLTQAMHGIEAHIDATEKSASVVVSLEGGRTQRVQVDTAVCDHSGIQLLRIFSVAGPVDSKFYRRALEINARFPHGALAIQRFDGEDHFVMVNSYPQATCDVDEVRHSVLTIAEKADELEHLLTGRDEW